MTISGIRWASAAATFVLVWGPSAATGQVTMPFPRIGGTGNNGLQVSPMQVRPIQTRSMRPGGGFNTGQRHDLTRPIGMGGSHSSSSTNIHASASGNNFSVGLHVGSDLGLRGVSRTHVGDHLVTGGHQQVLHNGHVFPVVYSQTGLGLLYRGYGYGYGNGYGFGYPYQNSYYSNVDGSYYAPARTYAQPQAAPPPPAEPLEPPTAEEIAAYELRYGSADDAVDLYRKLLRDAPEDAVSMRRLAVSLLKDKRFEEGVAMMAMAYRTDALLADETLIGSLFDNDKELRRLLQKCVIHANRTKLASAWLTVAVMMQAEDRDERALKMVDRAREAGLDIEIADSMKRALGG